MGKPWRRSWQTLLALLAMWVAAIASAQSPGLSSSDPPAFRAPAFGLARLGQDPVPARVLAGEFDHAFEAVSGNEIAAPPRQPTWWRLSLLGELSAEAAPQLVVGQPNRRVIELWRPGDAVPLRRSIYGPDTDFDHSTRFVVFPLHEMRRGEVLYLRLQTVDSTKSRVTFAPLAQVHRQDMLHVGLRSVVLTALGVAAVLAFGFWAGLRERGYAYLGLTLVLQILTLTADGGEMRAVPWLSQIAPDGRTNVVLNTAAVLASIRFLIFFLGLRTSQPRIARILDYCSISLGALLVVSVFRTWKHSALYGNLNLLLVIALVLYCTAVAARRRQREAYFLLLVWTPLMAVLVVRVGAIHQWWPEYAWLEYAFPVGLAFGGLGLLLGLTSKLQQLRRDRDTANRLATYDSLTGAMTRAAISQSLRGAVESAHRSHRPMSVVFFDIDHFKRINDEYGHRVGDETLRIVSLRTRNRLRAYDLFGRYGGDEVLVVLADTQLRDAVRVAEHLRESVSGSPLSIDGRLLPVSLSLGVAELLPGETPEQLLERADAALYASKSAGRDRVTGHTNEPAETEAVS